MAGRRGRDLFEILGSRAQGGRPAARKRAPAAGDSLVGVIDWLRGLLPTGRTSLGGGRRKASAGGWSGLIVVALAFVTFGLGFAIGRGTSGGGVSAEQLRREAPQSRAGVQPEWVAGSRPLSEQEEETALSTFGYGLVWYPAPQRQKAARLAAWLRDQGLTSTRLRPGVHRDSGESIYLVVCYTDESGARERSLLESLDEPAFAVGLGKLIRNLPARPTQYQKL